MSFHLLPINKILRPCIYHEHIMKMQGTCGVIETRFAGFCVAISKYNLNKNMFLNEKE